MAAVETPERGSSKVGPAGGCPRICGACPLAGSCGSRGEVVQNTEQIFSKESGGLRSGTFVFSAAIPRSLLSMNKVVPNEKSTSEETCPKCKQSISACTCRDSGTLKLAA